MHLLRKEVTMLKVPVDKNECCGCSGCADVCPVTAIKMQTDEEGFYYPKIDNEKCTDCGLCAKMCAFANYRPIENNMDMSVCYAAKHNNQDIRMNSRSGGVFVAFSDMILQRNGVIYGCVLDENLKAVHFRAENTQERNRMCRSKYVQSDLREIFPKVKADLDEGRAVLFSGTGCQVDGINAYLRQKKTDVSRFYTIDIICHGCVSPKIYEDYLGYLERKYKGTVTEFDFRDKTVCGWDGHRESFVINGKKRSSSVYRDLFYSNLSLRPSCYNCKYASVNHPSDITIADAWGIKNAKPEFNDNRGVSLYLINSEKGQELSDYIKKDCEIVKLNLADMMQPNLKSPTKPSGNREQFWTDYKNGGIDRLIEKYGTQSLKKRLKTHVKYKIRQIVQGKKYYLP